ncbi:MAG TPA: thrombospondin type 3 repeat-containing protein [Candidatus Paceibacterota bacterium]|nr:thrombospondin type 3 repeat-containing protein [Candidatus Paceibacterota bacterium]
MTPYNKVLPLNNCSGDHDSDGIPDGTDPCPDTPGTGGGDLDHDGIPDGCDTDIDGDGVPNNEDNCPWTPNPDQKDTDHDGIGDACQCDAPKEGGGCPATLAEQYVYGLESDGRVATLYPKTARDMSDHSMAMLFTRDLGDKEYELNDHLGNVRVRFSDVKLSQNTAGTIPYKVDLRGYTNYYPFGMAQPGREMNIAGGRYGYNGKEMDNDWNNGTAVTGGEGNSNDYGFRTYDPRLGRFLSVDPLAGGIRGIRHISMQGIRRYRRLIWMEENRSRRNQVRR